MFPFIPMPCWHECFALATLAISIIHVDARTGITKDTFFYTNSWNGMAQQWNMENEKVCVKDDFKKINQNVATEWQLNIIFREPTGLRIQAMHGRACHASVTDTSNGDSRQAIW